MTRVLTYKQRLFVEAYVGVANGNAAEAARIAGYSSPEIYGRQVLSKTIVSVEVAKRVASAAMSANEVLARVSDVATANILEMLQIADDGSWKVDLRLAKRRNRGHLIRKVKASRDGTEIELESKLAALLKLGEYHGLWNREKPPEISLVELALRLKEQYERATGVGHVNGNTGSDT